MDSGPMIGCGAAVELISISALLKTDDKSRNLTACASNCLASSVARSRLRLAMIRLETPFSRKWRPHSSTISPAPTNTTVLLARSPKTCFANMTVVYATETG